MTPIDNSTYWANQSINATMPMDAVVQTEPAIVPVATTFEPVVTPIIAITPVPEAVPVEATKPITENLSAIIGRIASTRGDMGKSIQAIYSQLAEIGFCDLAPARVSAEQPDTYNALGRLGYEAREMDAQAKILDNMLKVLLDQYPQV